MGSANTSAGGPWPSPPYTTAKEGWSLLAPLPVSPNPSSIQAAAPLQTVLRAQETHRRFRSPAQPAHRPCTRRRRTGSCACAAACTGRKAHSRPRTEKGRCAVAPRPSRSGTARTCVHTRSRGASPPTETPLRPPRPRPAHRGPAPHRERRVRNQVPVCGKGIRSLATLEVALTERRKPARDSEGETGENGVRGREEESVWVQDIRILTTCPLFPETLAHPCSIPSPTTPSPDFQSPVLSPFLTPPLEQVTAASPRLKGTS